MDINNRHHLHTVAKDRLQNAPAAPKITLIYGGIVVLSSLLSTGVSYLLGMQMSQLEGLRSIKMRSILSTVQTVLPILINFLLMAVELGFANTMLRISRGQFVSPQGLRLGFSRFWLLFRATLLQSLLYLGAVLISFYVSMQLFLFTPMSRKLTDLLAPLLTSSMSDPTALLEDPALTAGIYGSMAPMFIIMLVVLAAVSLPISYYYRMTDYVIIDKPGITAMGALRESRRMMRRRCMPMFRLDLTFWWYYLAMALSTVLCYGDVLLPLMGITLPFSAGVGYFLFLGIYLLASLAVIFFLRPRVEVSYALAYDAIRPADPPAGNGGAVLGNIFNM